MKKSYNNPKVKKSKNNGLSKNKAWIAISSLIKDVGYKTNSVELVKKNR